ncbi:MAG: amidohydrolase family protein [Rhizobiaceae bacterium]|nr:amidohydrolase family protein [Rhizobiaceae bacterium]
MTYDFLIRNGSVALPNADPAPADVAVVDGKIAAILSPGTSAEAKRTLDARGLTVLPGIIDVHLHLGHGADISRPRAASDAISETGAAASGGITTMIPYLLAAEEHREIFDDVVAVTTAGARIDFGYHLIISTEDQLAAVPHYVREFGVPSFKIFMNNRGGEGARLGLPDIDDAFLYRLAVACTENGAVLCPHPENIEVAQFLRKAVMAADPDGKGGLAAWNASRPPFIEADAIQRAALLCKAAGAPIYVVHTSSAEALAAAEHARASGVDITIETCPHYLTHDVDWTGGDVGKINPPLREAADREALWAGIASGSVDTVATDHVHRTACAKAGGIWKASPGCPGLETLLPVMLSEGHHKRGVPIRRLVSLLAEKPARSMGLWGRKGGIVVGFDADFAIVDLEGTQRASNATTQSDAGYTIYDGWDLKGRVLHTIVRGRPVVADGKLVEDAIGTGQYVRRSFAA